MCPESDRQYALEPVTISMGLATGDKGEVQMEAMPSRAQSESYKGLLPIELSVETPTVYTADLGNQQFATEQQSDRQENSRPLLVP
jgi:hypothetical protein